VSILYVETSTEINKYPWAKSKHKSQLLKTDTWLRNGHVRVASSDTIYILCRQWFVLTNCRTEIGKYEKPISAWHAQHFVCEKCRRYFEKSRVANFSNRHFTSITISSRLCAVNFHFFTTTQWKRKWFSSQTLKNIP